MIEKILEKLETEMNEVVSYDEDDYYLGKYSAYGTAMRIVQEVAKEYEEKTATISVDIGDLVNSVEYGMKAPYQKGE